MPITKNFAAIFAALSLLLSFSPALAVTSTSVNFCTRINDTTSQLNSLLTKLSNNRGNLRETMLKNLSDRKQERSAKIQTVRDNARSQFVANLNDLDSRATTDAQKQAVATFKSTVTAALATRNQAIDAAIATYQAAAKAEITARENKVLTATTTFQGEVQAAITKAKSDCAGGVAPATVRQTMGSSIRTANEAFRSIVTGLADKNLIKLAQTRDQAIQAANKAFKQTVESARTALKAALKPVSTSPTPAPTPEPESETEQ